MYLYCAECIVNDDIAAIDKKLASTMIDGTLLCKEHAKSYAIVKMNRTELDTKALKDLHNAIMEAETNGQPLVKEENS